MTSGNFSYVSVKSIIIDRDERQRTELEDIESLAESIKRNGLINPIVVTRDHVLVAGERRLTAHKHLGFDSIAVQYVEDLSDAELQILELEENIRRVDLPWKDLVKSVAKFHKLMSQENESWSPEQTADELNIARTTVGKYLMVQRAIEDNVEGVVNAPKLSQAANFATRFNERKKAATMRDLTASLAPSAPASPVLTAPDGMDIPAETTPAPVPAQRRYADLINTDFTKWADTVQDTPFNLIHCDFPYGVNAGDTKGQTGAAAFGHYADKPDDYFNLVSQFLAKQDNFIGPSAHMIFWFSMDFYQETVELFREKGWVVNRFPLIWFKSDNTGVIPDANRGPRRVYETALFMTRGDRKIVRAVGNCVGNPVKKEFHVSEKPKPMLEHFFRMLVDETTVMLDPTAGSGNAVAVAESLGAHYSLGLERDKDFYENAKINLKLE